MASSATGADISVSLVIGTIEIARCSISRLSETDNYNDLVTEHLGSCENSHDRTFSSITGTLEATAKNNGILAFRDAYMKAVNARAPFAVSINVAHLDPSDGTEYAYRLEDVKLDFAADSQKSAHNTYTMNFTTTRERSVLVGNPFVALGIPDPRA